jgi:hypothetical protein
MSVTANFALIDDGFPGSGTLPGWKQPADSNAPWIAASDSAYAGTFSFKSGTLSNNQQSEVSYASVFSAGNVSFARKVSSELSHDFLEFLIDGVVIGSWSGEVPWSVVSFPITAGRHTVLWRYRKDSSGSAGSDAAWIDSVLLPSKGPVDLAPILMLLLD